MERFRPDGDACLSIFRDVYEMGDLAFPFGATVLEIGCAEADWMTPMLAVRPDLQITGIDWRTCDRPGVLIQGDVLTHDFPPASFDVVVGISSIEHVGLGHYDNDPIDPDGDIHCMERVCRWLKPGGWCYADVPFGQTYAVEGTSHRIYDVATVLTRLVPDGLVVKHRWYTSGPTREIGDVAPTPAPDDMHYIAFHAEKS